MKALINEIEGTYNNEEFMTQVFPGYRHIKPEIEYLGLPYTHEDKFMLHFRAEVSNMIAAKLTLEGRIIFAPISAWHHIAMKYDLPGNFEYWEKLDEAFIKVSKKLLVIKLPGWDTSNGVTLEKKIANENGVPIEYINPEDYLCNTEKLFEEVEHLANMEKERIK